MRLTLQNSFQNLVLLNERTSTVLGSEKFRYGFQNQEIDDEVKGDGNSVNYKYRMHDPRLGRFFAIDPLYPEFPWNSPYVFSENQLFQFVELEGLERRFPAYRSAQNTSSLRVVGTNRTTTQSSLSGLSTSRGPIRESQIKIEEHPLETAGKILNDLGDLNDLMADKYRTVVKGLNGGAVIVQDEYNSNGTELGRINKTEIKLLNANDKKAMDKLESEYWQLFDTKVQDLLTKQGYSGGDCLPCTSESKKYYQDKSKPIATDKVREEASFTIKAFVMGPSPMERLRFDILNSETAKKVETPIKITVIQEGN